MTGEGKAARLTFHVASARRSRGYGYVYAHRRGYRIPAIVAHQLSSPSNGDTAYGKSKMQTRVSVDLGTLAEGETFSIPK